MLMRALSKAVNLAPVTMVYDLTFGGNDWHYLITLLLRLTVATIEHVVQNPIYKTTS